jgi:hypothetical protein
MKVKNIAKKAWAAGITSRFLPDAFLFAQAIYQIAFSILV